jgi:hypothetical protein
MSRTILADYLAKTLIPASTLTASLDGDSVNYRAGDGHARKAIFIVNVGNITDAGGVTVKLQGKDQYSDNWNDLKTSSRTTAGTSIMELNRLKYDLRATVTVDTPGAAPSVTVSSELILVDCTHGNANNI